MSIALQAIEISHRTARRALREQLAAQQLAPEALAAALAGDVDEHLVLSTCGRFELYVVGEPLWRDEWFARLANVVHLDPATLAPAVTLHEGPAAATHLFRVASGLESPILGEDHILGQVRAAYRTACRERTAGPALRTLFDRAIRVGRRVRRETSISRTVRSYATRAIEHVAAATPAGGRVAILGTGTIAHEIATALAPQTAELTIISRHTTRAAELAAAVNGRAATYDDLLHIATDLDALIACTAATTPILRADMLPQLKRDMLVIDLGMPRNVCPDVAACPQVRLLDLESLTGAQHVHDAVIRAAEHIVTAEVAAFVLPREPRRAQWKERVA
jgi:glutamyl-tRNA reductase